MEGRSNKYGDCMTEEALSELLSLECRVDSDGTLLYCNALGQWHRVHGPAVEYEDGEHVWGINGKRHRLDGPAVERPDGYCAWYIDGKVLTKAEWLQQVASMEHV